jgi:hypothetical protein
MSNRLLITFISLFFILAACQAATPPAAITSGQDTEFRLAPDQTTAITGSDLSIRLIGVAGDERCPSEIECAISGPVSISLSVQQGNETPVNINLQTFTDNNGRAPDAEFEGIETHAAYAGYLIRVVGVLPYPINLETKIKDSEYQVSLIVTQE